MKYTIEQNKQIITDVSLKNGVEPCVMLAFAKIESGFNNLAQSPSGTYAGLFQLADGYGGVKGDDRFDPYLNTQGAINKYKANQQLIESRIGTFEPYMAYLAHQQGAGGFLAAYQSPDTSIYDAKYSTNYLSNIPKSCKGQIATTGDFLTCWESKFNGLLDKCELPSAKNNKWLKIIVVAGIAGFVGYELWKSK